MAELSLDANVAQAMLGLMATIKPYHDAYFGYALAADTKEMKHFVKYIRKRSHRKGDQWKGILFFLNDFITLTEIPATPSFPADQDMDIPEVLDGMLEAETAIRKAIEQVMGLAYSVNEQRAILFLKDMVKDQTHHERKIDRMRTLWGELNGNVHEFQEEM